MTIYEALDNIIARLNAMDMLVHEPLLNENLNLAVKNLNTCVDFMKNQKFMITDEPKTPEAPSLEVVEVPEESVPSEEKPEESVPSEEKPEDGPAEA